MTVASFLALGLALGNRLTDAGVQAAYKLLQVEVPVAVQIGDVAGRRSRADVVLRRGPEPRIAEPGIQEHRHRARAAVGHEDERAALVHGDRLRVGAAGRDHRA